MEFVDKVEKEGGVVKEVGEVGVGKEDGVVNKDGMVNKVEVVSKGGMDNEVGVVNEDSLFGDDDVENEDVALSEGEEDRLLASSSPSNSEAEEEEEEENEAPRFSRFVSEKDIVSASQSSTVFDGNTMRNQLDNADNSKNNRSASKNDHHAQLEHIEQRSEPHAKSATAFEDEDEETKKLENFKPTKYLSRQSQIEQQRQPHATSVTAFEDEGEEAEKLENFKRTKYLSHQTKVEQRQSHAKPTTAFEGEETETLENCKRIQYLSRQSQIEHQSQPHTNPTTAFEDKGEETELANFEPTQYLSHQTQIEQQRQLHAKPVTAFEDEDEAELANFEPTQYLSHQTQIEQQRQPHAKPVTAFADEDEEIEVVYFKQTNYLSCQSQIEQQSQPHTHPATAMEVEVEETELVNFKLTKSLSRLSQIEQQRQPHAKPSTAFEGEETEKLENFKPTQYLSHHTPLEHQTQPHANPATTFEDEGKDAETEKPVNFKPKQYLSRQEKLYMDIQENERKYKPVIRKSLQSKDAKVPTRYLSHQKVACSTTAAASEVFGTLETPTNPNKPRLLETNVTKTRLLANNHTKRGMLADGLNNLRLSETNPPKRRLLATNQTKMVPPVLEMNTNTLPPETNLTKSSLFETKPHMQITNPTELPVSAIHSTKPSLLETEPLPLVTNSTKQPLFQFNPNKTPLLATTSRTSSLLETKPPLLQIHPTNQNPAANIPLKSTTPQNLRTAPFSNVPPPLPHYSGSNPSVQRAIDLRKRSQIETQESLPSSKRKKTEDRMECQEPLDRQPSCSKHFSATGAQSTPTLHDQLGSLSMGTEESTSSSNLKGPSMGSHSHFTVSNESMSLVKGTIQPVERIQPVATISNEHQRQKPSTAQQQQETNKCTEAKEDLPDQQQQHQHLTWKTNFGGYTDTLVKKLQSNYRNSRHMVMMNNETLNSPLTFLENVCNTMGKQIFSNVFDFQFYDGRLTQTRTELYAGHFCGVAHAQDSVFSMELAAAHVLMRMGKYYESIGDLSYIALYPGIRCTQILRKLKFICKRQGLTQPTFSESDRRINHSFNCSKWKCVVEVKDPRLNKPFRGQGKADELIYAKTEAARNLCMTLCMGEKGVQLDDYYAMGHECPEYNDIRHLTQNDTYMVNETWKMENGIVSMDEVLHDESDESEYLLRSPANLEFQATKAKWEKAVQTVLISLKKQRSNIQPFV